jgi:hypothetical protein
MSLAIRTYQPGDETAQAAIFNAVAAKLPGFKPATSEDVRRRTRATDFDAGMRFYAVAATEVVGYCTVNPNGRIGYPWCLPGHAAEELLLNAAIEAVRARGIERLFAAYRHDWSAQAEFFAAHGFAKAREMINFAQNLLDLPTLVIRRGLNVSPLKESDLPTVAGMAPNVLQLPPNQLSGQFLANPYFPADSVFVLRRADGSAQGVGVLIADPSYADPLAIDPQAPCYRLGAFGTEGMTTKRVRGLFSFLVRNDADATSIGLDLLSYALNRLQDDTIEALAAQVPSDAPHLLSFYQKYFRKQGGFPVFERKLD